MRAAMRTLRRSSVPAVLLATTLAAGSASAAPSLVLRGEATPPGDPIVRARESLAQRAPELASRSLEHLETVPLKDGRRVVRFRETHDGVPVTGAGASVVVRGDGGATPLAFSRVARAFGPSKPVWTVDAAAARASERLGVGVPAARGRLVYWEENGEHVLAWAFFTGFVPIPSPMAAVVVVDAADGTILATYDALRHAKLAKVHPHNPVSTPDLEEVTLDVQDGATIPENALIRAKNCIDEKTTKTIDVGMPITVHACNLKNKAIADASGDFLAYAPADDTDPEDAFAEVAMFYHVSQIYQYFLGLGMPELKTKPLPAVVNLRIPQGFDSFDLGKIGDPNLPLQPFDNAFFSPSDPMLGEVFGIDGAAMFFFQGTHADFGYDGDVVYHEFGHAMIDRTIQLAGTWYKDAQGARPAPGAMNEGIADYFSSALAGDPNVGEYASKSLVVGQAAIRTIDNEDDCLLDVSGEVHADSTFFSGALWGVRKGLSPADQAAYDKALLESLVMAPSGNVGYEDVAKLFDASLVAAGRQDLADALTAELGKRGQGPTCRRVREWDGKPINGRATSLGNSFFTGGKQSVPGTSKAQYAPGLFQIHAKVAGAQLTVGFTQVQAGGGGSPFGGGGKPFKPMVLAKFGAEPIAFAYAGGVTSNAGDAVEAAGKGNAFSATIDVPPGETDVHVMIVNGGDQDGGYRAVTLAFTGDLPSGQGGAAGAPGEPGGGAAGTTSDPPAAAPSGSDDGGGCGCVVAGQKDALQPAWALGLLGAAALLRRRQRR